MSINDKKEKSVFTTNSTSGITSILQLIDATPNEIFAFGESTSATQEWIRISIPIEKIEKTGEE